jgi:transcription elongation factor S-II
MPIRKITDTDKFRENIRNKLGEILDVNNHTIININNLEKGILNWSLKEATNRKVVKKWDNPFFVQIYIDHLRSIYMNLKNTKLVTSLQNGDIKSQEIAFLTHQEMKPDKWEDLIKAKSIRDKNKFEQNLEAMTDTFTCRKCRSKKCSYYALQTRSADEPMTLFITCLECGTRMKK